MKSYKNKDHRKFRVLYLFFFILCVFVFISCTKNKNSKIEPNYENGRVAFLFGYGYNDEEFVERITQLISNKFGLYENGGLVVPYVYPKDFYSNGISGRISNLADYVLEKKCKALITIGAPEFTHKALAKIKDENPKCFIISLFSQDDVLGIEADSDIVLDFVEEAKTVKSENSEMELAVEGNLQHMDKMDQIIIQTIKSVAGINSFTRPDAVTLKVISKIFGSDWEVATYLDSSTGLRAKNHFVLKYIEKAFPKKEKVLKKIPKSENK